MRSNSNSNNISESSDKAGSTSSRSHVEEFMSLDYFYKGMDTFDSAAAQMFSWIIDFIKKDVIRLRDLQQLLLQKRGIPEQARGLLWRVLMNYLPETRKHWTNIMETSAKQYEQLVEEFIISRNRKNVPPATQNSSATATSATQSPLSKMSNPIISSLTLSQSSSKQSTQNTSSNNQNNNISGMAIIDSTGDHPLNRKKTSNWNGYFKDLDIWETIEKDTRRTRAEFFSQKNETPILYSGIVAKLNRKLIPPTDSKQTESSQISENPQQKQQQQISVIQPIEYKYDVITRILFLYYKITPEGASVRYVQGMNEVVGIIYQCFSTENCEYLLKFAESDTFYCFCLVMARVKTIFNFSTPTTSSESDRGGSFSRLTSSLSFRGSIDAFVELFRRADPQLSGLFGQLSIDPKLYCLGWMMGFFCQTFDAQKAMKVWDCLFISGDIIEFMPYICVAILYVNRDELVVKTTTSEIILKLQTVAMVTNIEKLTKTAFALFNEFPPRKKIYA